MTPLRPSALTPALSHGERENTQPVGPCKRSAAGRIRQRCGLMPSPRPSPTGRGRTPAPFH
ncbi:hypothetical protein D8768_21690 [Enterobacter hormaechei]|nr:hypothetical protein D8768_21690 [Enterobacter hormaechei]